MNDDGGQIRDDLLLDRFLATITQTAALVVRRSAAASSAGMNIGMPSNGRHAAIVLSDGTDGPASLRGHGAGLVVGEQRKAAWIRRVLHRECLIATGSGSSIAVVSQQLRRFDGERSGDAFDRLQARVKATGFNSRNGDRMQFGGFREAFLRQSAFHAQHTHSVTKNAEQIRQRPAS